MGRHFSLFYLKEDIAAGKPKEQLRKAIGMFRVEEEGWRVRKDGPRLWVSATLTAMRNGRGELVGLVKITRDLTERKINEKAPRQNEARTRLIVDTALDAVMTINEECIITEWNAQAERTFGWSYDEAVGSRISELLIPPRYRAAHETGLRGFFSL